MVPVAVRAAGDMVVRVVPAVVVAVVRASVVLAAVVLAAAVVVARALVVPVAAPVAVAGTGDPGVAAAGVVPDGMVRRVIMMVMDTVTVILSTGIPAIMAILMVATWAVGAGADGNAHPLGGITRLAGGVMPATGLPAGP